MIDRPHYESQILDHLGLVAGMFDELALARSWIKRPNTTLKRET